MLIEDYIISKEIDKGQKHFTFPYLDMELIEKKTEDEYSEIVMKTKVMLVETEEFSVTASITEEQISRLQEDFGIDVKGQLTSALEHEFENGMEVQILHKMYEIATEVVVNETKMKWWNQIFGYWNPPYKADDNNAVLASILKASNIIAKNSRMGPGNFAIMSAGMGNLLKESSCVELSEKSDIGPQGLYKTGSFSGMDILIDPRISYGGEQVILIGRNTKEEKKGIVNIFTEPIIQTIATANLDAPPSTQIRKSWDGKIFNTPNAKESYCKINLTYEKYPFWNHIKTRVKNLF